MNECEQITKRHNEIRKAESRFTRGGTDEMKNICVMLANGVMTIPCSSVTRRDGWLILENPQTHTLAEFRELAIIGWYIEGVLAPTKAIDAPAQ